MTTRVDCAIATAVSMAETARRRHWERLEQKYQKIRKYDESVVVIAALIDVHRAGGPGLLESAYQARPLPPFCSNPFSFLIF
jgi:hypothetical protein